MRVTIAATALFALPGCLNLIIKGDVLASSSASLTAEAEPLSPGEGIVIIGRTASDDDDIPGCVRDALADASPGTRIVAPDIFRSKAGGRLTNTPKTPGVWGTDEEMEAILREAEAQRAVADLAVHYLFLIEGKTEGSADTEKWTDIAAAVWDAPAIRNIGRIGAYAIGHPPRWHNTVQLGVYYYTPTESMACEKMAGEIQRFLSTGYKPGS